jgi:hypothetical protein
MGKRSNDWQAMDEVLALFGEKKAWHADGTALFS